MPEGDNERFPYFVYICLGTVFLGNCLTITFIFPFVGYMILHLGIVTSIEKVGFYQGLVTAAFFMGRAVGSKFWGQIADKYGRKIVLYISLVSSALCVMWFGFSSSLFICFTSRFLCGLFSGIIPIVKSMAGEMVTNEDHMALAQMVPAISYITSFIVGPAVGGILSNPCENSNFLAYPIFCEYPYLLPCVAIFITHVLLLLPCCWFLPETNIEGRQRLRRHFKKILMKCLFCPSRHLYDLVEPPLVNSSRGYDKNYEFSNTAWLLVYLQCIFITVTTSTTLANNLLFIAPRLEFGGLQYDPLDLGLIFSTVGALSLIFQLGIGHKLLHHFKAKNCLLGVTFMKCPIMLSIPVAASYFALSTLKTNPTFYTASISEFASFSGLLFSLQICEMLLAASITILTNNAVCLERRCELQGIMAGKQSVLQATVPVLVGAEFAYFLQRFHNNWIIFAQTSFVTLLLCVIVKTKL